MQAIIKPAAVAGTITAPASKSVMQRTCAAALLSGGTTVIHNYGKSDDDKAALQIICDLGATVTYVDDHTLEIAGDGSTDTPPAIPRLDCGESGLSVRMFTPVAARAAHEITIEGKGSLTSRPMDFFDEVLPLLGVSVSSNEGKLPVRVKGPLLPQDITIDGSLSSQFLTGLLFVYAASGASDVSITVDSLSSRGYIDLTLQVMEAFGMNVPRNEDYRVFRFLPADIPSSAGRRRDISIEGDWSGAAFLMVAGAIAGHVTVEGLDVFSVQADKKILEALQDCGCRLSIQADRIEVSRRPLKAFHFNATGCPDLFPPLVALAAYCEGASVIEGVHRLQHKESNRALTLQEEFGKLGIEIVLQDDLMIIPGGKVCGGRVSAHHDHRIAMACAVAALGADEPVTIDGADAINKSYPDFYNHLAALGVPVQTI